VVDPYEDAEIEIAPRRAPCPGSPNPCRTTKDTDLTALTLDEAGAAAAEVVERLSSSRPRPLSEAGALVLEVLLGRHAGTARAALRVAPATPSVLPADTDPDPGGPAFADRGEAETWYLAHADGVIKAMQLAAGEKSDRYVAQIARCLHSVASTTHELERAALIEDLGLAAARRLDDPLLIAYALLMRGGTYKMADRPARAIELYTEASGLFASVQDRAGSAATANQLGAAHMLARNLNAADAAFTQVLGLTGEDDLARALAHLNRSEIASERGEPSAAIDRGFAGLHMLRTLGADPRWIAQAHLALARAFTVDRDHEGAGDQLAKLLALIRGGAGTRTVAISAALAEGELRLSEHRFAEGLDSFRRALLLQSAGSHPWRMADTADGIGRAQFGLGDCQPAADQHISALTERLRVGELFATARTRFHLACALAATGATDEAAHQRVTALGDLVGIVDPAADSLRTDLTSLAI
jgi:tetratricopeptide (TPR) repeat protein